MKKMNALLVCGSGASSGFMAANMRKAASKVNIPKWRSHLIRQNRATYSNLENHLIQITEPGNPI